MSTPAPHCLTSLLDDDLTRAVLLTVLYADLFDQALTVEELWRYLVLRPARWDEVEAALARAAAALERHDGLVTWRGRGGLVAERRRRRERSAEMWRQAERYAGWMRRAPWVRMVAVCGSLAVENPRADSDIDLFLITAPRRLWLVQVLAMLLKRRAALAGMDVCPNTFLSSDALEIRRRSLFLAREVAQATPLWGGEAHRAFRDANSWIFHFLPNVDAAARREPISADTPSAAGRGERWLEALSAGGRFATLVDRLVHSLLLSYYGLRLRHRGLDRHRLATSYRRDRQEVAAGGYASAVEETFRRRVGDRLGEHEALGRDLERLFPSAGRRERPDPSFARLLSSRYGESRLGEAS